MQPQTKWDFPVHMTEKISSFKAFTSFGLQIVTQTVAMSRELEVEKQMVKI